MNTPDSDPFEQRFVTLAGQMAEAFSFNRSIGQLYGFLYISSQPISLEEVASACHMSKGNASLHLRTLENWGAVHRSWKAGTRKDYYTANYDLKGLALRRLQEGLEKRLKFFQDQIASIKAEGVSNGSGTNPARAHWQSRFQDIEASLSTAASYLEILTGLTQNKKLSSLLSLLKHTTTSKSLKRISGTHPG